MFIVSAFADAIQRTKPRSRRSSLCFQGRSTFRGQNPYLYYRQHLWHQNRLIRGAVHFWDGLPIKGQGPTLFQNSSSSSSLMADGAFWFLGTDSLVGTGGGLIFGLTVGLGAGAADFGPGFEKSVGSHTKSARDSSSSKVDEGFFAAAGLTPAEGTLWAPVEGSFGLTGAFPGVFGRDGDLH